VRGLPKLVKQHLEKARESALMAVETYNKPATHFKSFGYIVLMVIAWTALFHAIFFRRKKKPFVKGDNGRFVRVPGGVVRKEDGSYAKLPLDIKHWELAECLKMYYGNDTQNPVRLNLEFFIGLRNKIEHRHLPALDPTIFGESQAMLLNFDDMLGQEFGEKYRVKESLSFALQLFPKPEVLADAVKRSASLTNVLDFVAQYRSAIDANAWASGKFAFKAFLIQVPNHESREAMPVQFVHYGNLTPDQQKELDRFVVMVKPTGALGYNPYKLKVADVVSRVQAGLGDPKVERGTKQVAKFNQNTHTQCWKKYGARPAGNDPHPERTNTMFCRYDDLHGDYAYTQAWVESLIAKMKTPGEFESLAARQRAQGIVANPKKPS